MHQRVDQDRPGRLYPVVLAVRQGKLLAFWCPHCRRRHYHGVHMSTCGCPCPLHDGQQGSCRCPLGSGDGHRSAHCTDDDRPGSPFRKGGYIVVETSIAELDGFVDFCLDMPPSPDRDLLIRLLREKRAALIRAGGQP